MVGDKWEMKGENLEKRYGQLTRDLLFSAQGSFSQRFSKAEILRDRGGE